MRRGEYKALRSHDSLERPDAQRGTPTILQVFDLRAAYLTGSLRNARASDDAQYVELGRDFNRTMASFGAKGLISDDVADAVAFQELAHRAALLARERRGLRHVSVRAVDQLGKVGPVELLKSMCFG
jgi:hypothetical protein